MRKSVKLTKFHLVVFILGAIILSLVTELGFGVQFFWPVFVWGVIIIIHLMYSISTNIDDKWAIKRADDLVNSSYDLHHIENIRERRTAPSSLQQKPEKY